MTKFNDKISNLIENQLPDFVIEDHPKFVEFLKTYYTFMESAELQIDDIEKTDGILLETETNQNNNLLLDAGSLGSEKTQLDSGDKIILENSSFGKFQYGETIVGQNSKAASKILFEDLNNNRLYIVSQNKFIKNETIIGQSSGAKAKILNYRPNPVQNIQELLNNRDPDKVISFFLDKFRDEFLKTIPELLDDEVEKRKLIKNIKSLYKLKGTQKGHELFFKILFNENSETIYPRENILRVSDGKWNTKTIIRAIDVIGDTNKLIGRTIIGETTGSQAIVENVFKYAYSGLKVSEFVLNKDSIQGDFLISETIKGTASDQEDFFIKCRISGLPNNVTFLNNGSLNGISDKIGISGGGQGALYNIDSVGSGSIEKIFIENPGYDFNIGDKLIFDNTGTGGQGAEAFVRVVNGGFHFENGVYESESIFNDTNLFPSGDVLKIEQFQNQTVEIEITVQNIGGSNKYFIDDVQQDKIYLTIGYTYEIDWSKAPDHPFDFSTTDDGIHNGGTAFTNNVTVDLVNKKTTIVVDNNTPNLYYFCQVHSGMGGETNTPSSFETYLTNGATVTGFASESQATLLNFQENFDNENVIYITNPLGDFINGEQIEINGPNGKITFFLTGETRIFWDPDSFTGGFDETFFDVGDKIIGNTSNAKCRFVRVKSYGGDEVQDYSLFVNRITGSFEEFVFETATVSKTDSTQFQFNIAMRDYYTRDELNFHSFQSKWDQLRDLGTTTDAQDRIILEDETTSGDLYEGNILVQEENSGVKDITDIFIISGGKGYKSLPKIDVDNASSGKDANIKCYGSEVGRILNVKNLEPGIEYQKSPSPQLNFYKNLLLTNLNNNFIPGETVSNSTASFQGVVVSFNRNNYVLKIKDWFGDFNNDYNISGSISNATANIRIDDTTQALIEVNSQIDVDGSFLNQDGHVSENTMKIQDSLYYQDFSYVIKVGRSIVEWRDSFKKTMHTSGFYFTGLMSIENLLNVKTKSPVEGIVSGIKDTPIFSIINTLFATIFGRRLGTDTDGTTLRSNPAHGVPADLDPATIEHFPTKTRDLTVKIKTSISSITSRIRGIVANEANVIKGFAYCGPNFNTINKFANTAFGTSSSGSKITFERLSELRVLGTKSVLDNQPAIFKITSDFFGKKIKTNFAFPTDITEGLPLYRSATFDFGSIGTMDTGRPLTFDNVLESKNVSTFDEDFIKFDVDQGTTWDELTY